MKHKHEVRTVEEALLYLTDCTLATVSGMAMLKSRKKHEYERQIAMAQQACDWIYQFNITVPTRSRIHDVLSTQTRSVRVWADKYEAI